MPAGAVSRIGIIKLDRQALRRIIRDDPRSSGLCRDAAIECVEAAKAVFRAQQNRSNEHDLSENTPPKYINSFDVHRVPKANPYGFAWHAANQDPAWNMVEWGSHAGGKTPVLRYRPLGRGFDIVTSRHQ